MEQIDLKEQLAIQASGTKMSPQDNEDKVRITRGMSIPDIVKALEPELKKALPSSITPERFTRIALSALNNTPALKQCTPMSFIAALLNAAQLGVEVNTPLGLAYLILFHIRKKEGLNASSR